MFKSASKLTTFELFDLLAERVGHDPDRPGWTPKLIELHRHSLSRRLPILPEFWGSPVYDPAKLPESVWGGTFEAGVRYDADAQVAFLEEVHRFGPELESFDVEPSEPEAGLRRFYWKNTEFSHGDAVLYYSLLRHLKPRRVVEIGGGFSTLLASAAAERNGSTEIVCAEPHPRPFLERGLPHVELLRKPAQELAPAFFRSLREGDVLFYDGTHICRTGSDVSHVLLRVLPALAKGVWVHVHDIFLPFEYPRGWAEQRLYWNEQYVLAALLANSNKYEVVAANYWLWRTSPQRLERFVPRVPDFQPGGTSFWMRTLA